MLKHYGIDLVLDVGANAGQYALAMREDVGYRGKMISFEPVNAPFAKLSRAAEGDPLWKVQHFGIGDKNERVEINIAGNSFSSSLLRMLPLHHQSAPESQYTGTELIEIRTLDSLDDEWLSSSRQIYLKIDTQGFEKNVLLGASHRLHKIGTIQLEMSLVALYDGELLFPEMHRFLSERGYRMVAVEPGFMDRTTGELLQVDGIYRRLEGRS